MNKFNVPGPMTVACYARAILNLVAWQQAHTLNKSDCAYFIIRHDLLKLITFITTLSFLNRQLLGKWYIGTWLLRGGVKIHCRQERTLATGRW